MSAEDESSRYFEPQEEADIIDLHCDRILAAAQACSWDAVLEAFDGEGGHKQFQALLCNQIPFAIEQSKLHSVNWKVRVLVDEAGNVEILPAPVVLHYVYAMPQWPSLPKNLPQTCPNKVCKVLVDSIPTPPSILTTHKTTSREHYDKARSRLGIAHLDPTEREVLLFNEDRELMEASLCTPYFLRDGRWLTPALSSGGNAGVSRRKALEAGLCVESTLHVGELVAGEMIWLSNAVRGFIPGKLQLSKG